MCKYIRATDKKKNMYAPRTLNIVTSPTDTTADPESGGV